MSMDKPVQEMDRQELVERVEKLEGDVSILQTMFEGHKKKFRKLEMALFSNESMKLKHVPAMETDFERIADQGGVHPRLLDLEEKIEEVKKNNEMLVTDIGSGRDDPDGRAKLIRQTLVNKTNGDGKASMTRDEVESRLGGGLHRDSVLDAMKRAADGKVAEEGECDYTPINGASDLQPVDAIRFDVSTGMDRQSRLVMDLSDSTQSEMRQNLTTGAGAGGV